MSDKRITKGSLSPRMLDEIQQPGDWAVGVLHTTLVDGRAPTDIIRTLVSVYKAAADYVSLWDSIQDDAQTYRLLQNDARDVLIAALEGFIS